MVPVNSTWLESVFIVMQSSSERGSERNEKIFFVFRSVHAFILEMLRSMGRLRSAIRFGVFGTFQTRPPFCAVPLFNFREPFQPAPLGV